jgi:hypothetical protein
MTHLATKPEGTTQPWAEMLPDLVDATSEVVHERLDGQAFLDEATKALTTFRSQLSEGTPVLHIDTTFPYSIAGYTGETPLKGYRGPVLYGDRDHQIDLVLQRSRVAELPLDGDAPEVCMPELKKTKQTYHTMLDAGWGDPPLQLRAEIATTAIGVPAIEEKLETLSSGRQFASAVVLEAAGVETDFELDEAIREEGRSLVAWHAARLAVFGLDGHASFHGIEDLAATNAVVGADKDEVRKAAQGYIKKRYQELYDLKPRSMARASVDACLEWALDRI